MQFLSKNSTIFKAVDQLFILLNVQRLTASLDIQQLCAGDKFALGGIDMQYNSQSFRRLNKQQTYYTLFRNIKSKRVNKYRLCVLPEQYFSNTLSTGNYDQLLAYLGRVDHDSASNTLDKLPKNKLGEPIFDAGGANAVFEKSKADPRFKIEGRRAIMA